MFCEGTEILLGELNRWPLIRTNTSEYVRVLLSVLLGLLKLQML